MHDLRLMGVHEDGEHLLLSDSEGKQYLLPIDEPVRAAVRRDRAHLGQLQIEMSGELRPRDVQAQIRSGASAEEVSERTGWPVERVRRYEGAVLAERAHIVDLGRDVVLRRRGSDPAAQTLAQRVEQRLTGRGVELSAVEWDSWRIDEGPWHLLVRFVAGERERTAGWTFDPATRTVAAQDDEALWLSEDEKAPAAAQPIPPAPHLSAVPAMTAEPARHEDRVFDLDAEGGLGLPEPVEVSSAVDLVGAMRQRRHGRRRHPEATSSGPVADTLEIDAGPSVVHHREEMAPERHPFPFAEGLKDRADAVVEDDAPPSERSIVRSAAPDPDEAAPPSRPRGFGPPSGEGSATAQAPAQAPTQPGGEESAQEVSGHRRPRRPSMPSWDEIMFGGKRD